MTIKTNKNSLVYKIIYFMLTLVACTPYVSTSVVAFTAQQLDWITIQNELNALPRPSGYTMSAPCQACTGGTTYEMYDQQSACIAECTKRGCEAVRVDVPAYHCILTLQGCNGLTATNQDCRPGYVTFTNNNPKASGSCSTNADCTTVGQVCNNGTCTAPPAPAAPTCTSSQCASATPKTPICDNGNCRACGTDSECSALGAGLVCQTDGSCGPECISNSSCANPTPTCRSGHCKVCSSDGDCVGATGGPFCDSTGSCTPKCSNNAQCGTDKNCVNGACQAKALTLCP